MQWLWRQNTGELLQIVAEGLLSDVIAIGYSGVGIGKNVGARQCDQDIGPIPRGKYTIGSPRADDTPTKLTLPLTPDPQNYMCGRTGFLVHGDATHAPGWASQGCIILDLAARQKIANSDVNELVVVDS